MRMIKTCSKNIISYVAVGVPLLNVWYTETFHKEMIGIRVYASKKFYNVLLCNYKLVEEGGITEVCILIVLLSCFIQMQYLRDYTYWIKYTLHSFVVWWIIDLTSFLLLFLWLLLTISALMFTLNVVYSTYSTCSVILMFYFYWSHRSIINNQCTCH